MTNSAFPDALALSEIDARAPSTQKSINSVVEIVHKLYKNNIDGAKEALCKIIRAELNNEELKTTVACLGCTELSTAFPENIDQAVFMYDGITFLNVYVSHVDEILRSTFQ